MKSIVTGIELNDEQSERLVILHRNIAGFVDNPGAEEIKFFTNLAKEVKQGLVEHRVSLKSKIEHALEHMADWAQGKPVPPLPQLLGQERETLFAELNAMNEAVTSGNFVDVTEKIF